MNFTTHEKVATIAISRRSGVFGEYEFLPSGAAKIKTDGLIFIVSIRGDDHWNVRLGDIEGIDNDLETAARLALEGANVSP